jgi:universal stress protein A
MSRPTILCPIDFSVASRGALRYAIAIAERFGGRVSVLTVNDPLLSEAADLHMGAAWLASRGDQDMRRFIAQAVDGGAKDLDVAIHVATGKPAEEILRRAHEDRADLIVMSSRGNSGVRKFFFGATTERVLRETEFPVLVTPAHDPGPSDLDDLRRSAHHVLVPVDFMGATSQQLNVARAIAGELGTTVLLTHVVEPLWFATAVQPRLPNTDNERRHRADVFLMDAAGPGHTDRKVELLTAFGDPAEEIAKIAADRKVGLIVMGLHASPRSGPRMGSVTYRVLCLAPTLVLALPPTLIQGNIASRFSTTHTATPA